MKIFPAIDIRDGKVVRLTHGDFNKEVRYEITPMEAAVQFAEAGAKNLHIVDLDGAKDDKLSNFDIIKEIVEKNRHVCGGRRRYPQSGTAGALSGYRC